MISIVNLYSPKENEIKRFLKDYMDFKGNLDNDFEWKCTYKSPLQLVDIIGIYVDNIEKYNITMWISIDPDISININNTNANIIINYLYERFSKKNN